MSTLDVKDNGREYMQVKGFTRATDLRMSPATLEEYESLGMEVPKPGEYCQNNGVIAAVTSRGEVVVWVAKEDPSTPREVSSAQAIENLRINGYKEANFGVPTA